MQHSGKEKFAFNLIVAFATSSIYSNHYYLFKEAKTIFAW
jgi:hypothetical protein